MRITLGVTGGVAAYKAAELVRRLQQDGFTVQVVMTRGAREFVTPLTFASLSGEKVITDLFSDSSGGEANLESAIEHIAVAQRTDLLLVAPATADIIAKFARGIADDFLTTLYLASTAPVVVAPAMNVNMWNHAATQENVELLRARGKNRRSGRRLSRVRSDRSGTAGRTGRYCGGRARGAENAAGFGRRNGPDNGRTDLRRSRSGSLHYQPLVREDGLCR